MESGYKSFREEKLLISKNKCMNIEGEVFFPKTEKKKGVSDFEADSGLSEENLKSEAISLRRAHEEEVASLLRNRELRIEKIRDAEKTLRLLYADLDIGKIVNSKFEESAKGKKTKERIDFIESAIASLDNQIAKVEQFDYSDNVKKDNDGFTAPIDRLHEDANRENIRKTHERLLEEGVRQYSERMQFIYDNMERESLTLQIGEEKGSKNFDATVESLVEKIKNVLSSALVYQRDSITKKMRELEGNGEWQPLGFSGSLPGRLLVDLQEKIQRNEGKRHSDTGKLDSLWRAIAPKVGSFVM